MEFKTKAETLALISKVLLTAKVPPLAYFSVNEWESAPSELSDRIYRKFGSNKLCVRSSCYAEDTVEESNAGKFHSELNVGFDELGRAIDKVIESYTDGNPRNQILVQAMLENVVTSGVAFSHCNNTMSPYRIVNWAETSDTTIITAGNADVQNLKIWTQAESSNNASPSEISKVIELLEELLQIFQRPLEIEFAVTKTGSTVELFLLQVRPLIIAGKIIDSKKHASILTQLESTIASKMKPHPFVVGERSIFGIMPDWNPAEIIGIRPKPLALSLYRNLITDNIWAYQRHNYGYRNLRGHPLMVSLMGIPYIDVRLSFNSFIPIDLDEELAGKLVEFYTQKLSENPNLHDKIEFEVVYSCYTLDLPQRLSELLEAGFSSCEIDAIKGSLRNLTNSITNPKTGLWKHDLRKLDKLKEKRQSIISSDLTKLEKIFCLLEDGRRYGTLPFAGLARAGFVAIQLLRSLHAVGILSQADVDSFILGTSTVSGQLKDDLSQLDRRDFLKKYGHLRPGTYDILSSRYDETPDMYFNWDSIQKNKIEKHDFSLKLNQLRDIEGTLMEHGLNTNVVEFLNFIQAGISSRELAKFEFTKNLSQALVYIEQFAEDHNITKDEIAYCDIHEILSLNIEAFDAKDRLKGSISRGKSEHIVSKSLLLPNLITTPEQVWGFEGLTAEPNFITLKDVVGKVAVEKQVRALENAIVCIPNADPGFDWIFTLQIGGLITCWGGANSHMAIRAAELGIPAVIGAGEQLYAKWSASQVLHLDCAGRRVEILQ